MVTLAATPHTHLHRPVNQCRARVLCAISAASQSLFDAYVLAKVDAAVVILFYIRLNIIFFWIFLGLGWVPGASPYSSQ